MAERETKALEKCEWVRVSSRKREYEGQAFEGEQEREDRKLCSRAVHRMGMPEGQRLLRVKDVR